MKMLTTELSLAAVFAASCLMNQSAFGQSDSSTSLQNAERANRLIGREVRTDGGRAGELDNLVVDFESGRVLYAVVDTGDSKVALPPGVFAKSNGEALRVSVDRQKLKNAPKVTQEVQQSSEMGRASFVSRVHRHFGEKEWWQGGGRSADEGSFNNVHRLSDIRNVRLMNVTDQPMGDINNVVVDLPAGRVVYVLLEPSQDLGLGNNFYALPPSAVTMNTKSGKTSFTSDIDKEKLANAPHLSGNNWSKLKDRSFAVNVYNYYGKQAWFDTSGALQPTGRDTGRYSPASTTEEPAPQQDNQRRGWKGGQTQSAEDSASRQYDRSNDRQ